MSTLELVAFGILWFVLLVLVALVLALYRLVEKAYQAQAAGTATGLLPGVEAPDIELLADDGVESFDFTRSDELLLTFVSTSCGACQSLMADLLRDDLKASRNAILVSGVGWSEYTKVRRPGMEIRWVAHPPDVMRDYGVTAVPTSYYIRDRAVVALSAATTGEELATFVKEARQGGGVPSGPETG